MQQPPDNIRPSEPIPERLFHQMLLDNQRRLDSLNARYNPVTGQGAPGRRIAVVISDFLSGRTVYLPKTMLSEVFIRVLINCGSIQAYIAKYCQGFDYATARETVFQLFVRLRCKHDFYFFAYCYARIKNKDGGPDIPFLLRHAQVKLVQVFESMRLAQRPIRVILLKCRQWGGSTATDIYMGWIQIFWKTNWNSNIIGHQTTSASNVFAMYEKLIDAIPMWLFFDLNQRQGNDNRKFAGVGTSQNIRRMIPRQCNIQTGSARNPESARSGDAAMAHITEEAFFPDTIQWTPEKVVNAAISSIQPDPLTFIVRESTPNGKDNEFHDEWQRTKQTNPQTGQPLSAYTGVFVPWFEIEKYTVKLSPQQRREFLTQLWDNRFDQRFGGAYYWNLFHRGATLEGIKWYIQKASEYHDLDDMKQEYPSDDIEAFKYSGTTVFDDYKINQLEQSCRVPVFIGDIEGDSVLAESPHCMDNLRLVSTPGGPFSVWEYPYTDEIVADQYIVAVDIGGSHKTSDYHDIVVLDRYDIMYQGVAVVVAEWHGHCDPDQLAMRCAQIASFYNQALLAVENNTAYSKMNNTDGDVSQLFFPILTGLYDDIGEIYQDRANRLLRKQKQQSKLGFNTNRSTKEGIINNYRRKVRRLAYVEREKEALVECSYYMLYPNGTYGAAPGKHDDRVMARAIALWISDFDMPVPKVIRQRTPEEIRYEEYIRRNNDTPPELANI